MNIQHLDREKIPPTLSGAFDAAWKCDLDAVRKDPRHANGVDSTVAAWVVLAPNAHPLWAYYAIISIHLRPDPQMPPAKIWLPGASHEIWCIALDPEQTPDLLSPLSTMLRPVNFIGQHDVYTRLNPVDQDKAATTTTENVVLDIVRGALSPDTDARRDWCERFVPSRA